MARAIDADALWKEVEPYGLHKGCILGKHGGLADILMDIIEKQPTISLAKQEWISVKDRLPERDQKVLVYDAGDETEIHVYHLREDLDGLYWDDESGWAVDFENVTHWMPLPEPPKEE